MEKTPHLGITSGFPTGARFSNEHIPNGARLYRWSLIEKLRRIQPITGFDSWIKFKTRQLGYEVQGFPIRYKEQRKSASRNALRRHYFWGRSTHLIGQPLPIAIIKSLRYTHHKPFLLGGMIFLFSYLVHRLTRWRIPDPRYYAFAKGYFNNLIRRGVRKWI